MRRAARVDDNQGEVVDALRRMGVSVQLLHAVGAGCPDLLCADGGKNFLVEVKDGAKPPSAQKLTPDQVKWHIEWRAPVHIINSVDAAIKLVHGIRAGGI